MPQFPTGFTWGMATASYQLEGGVDQGGRGPSVWGTLSHRPDGWSTGRPVTWPATTTTGMPTLFHRDLPQALEDRRGWLERDIAHRFADYADQIAGGALLGSAPVFRIRSVR